MKLNDEGDYSWAFEHIQQNKSIPVILVDECDDITIWRNIDIEKEIEENNTKRDQYLLQSLNYSFSKNF